MKAINQMNGLEAMAELCKVLRADYPRLSYPKLSKITGIYRGVINRAFIGVSVSPKLAQWISDTYGGVCVELCDAVMRDYKKRLGDVQARAAWTLPETHNVLPIPDYEIPHPQPVYLGKPLYEVAA